MSPWATIKVAIKALLRNKLRSLLTVLGIVIGVAAVIAMVAIGQGARNRVKGVFEAMGTNLLVVSPASQNTGGVRGGGGTASTLTFSDIDFIRNEASAVRWVAPQLQTKVQAAGDDQNWNTQVTGTTPEYFQIRSWAATSGQLFDDAADAGGAKVAVVGNTIVQQLYGGANPVGQTVRLGNVPFTIVGVLAVKGQSPMGQDYDDVIIIPSRTFRAKLQGGLGNFLRGSIYVSAVSADATALAESQVTEVLRAHHKLKDDEEDDFRVRNLAEFAEAQSQSTDTITTLLAAIAAVSLLVGGIGVMNIMLVSVVERTREIGIRMAVGARPIDLMVQFLAEALVLAALGGLIGLGVGALAASTLATKFGWAVVFPSDVAALAVLVSGGIGVTFGLYPAVKASRLDPITALRFEA
ncbi:MAG: ABC transporter permease [Deltaproteobacteria bacterium]|nr:ABC transporter permease [Deltaproteobacteria bacterium]